MKNLRVQVIKDKQLRKIHKRDIPSYFIFFDTETHQVSGEKIESHDFRLGWSCLWDRKNADEGKRYEWKEWDENEGLCRYIHTEAMKKGKVVIAGHNIFFDLQVIGFFDYFTKQGWKAKFLYDRGQTFILKCTHGDKVLTALSTTNWFNCPLRELGRLIGVEKMEVDFSNVADSDLSVYCRRDVEIILKAVQYYIAFIRDNDLGQFSLSKASQAFTAFRYRFMHVKIRVHNEQQAKELERKCYFGSRTECFQLGQVEGEGFVSLDVNSIYPFVMVEHEYPTQLVEYLENPPAVKIRNTVKGFCATAEIEVDTPEPVFAVKHKGKTVFPVGRFTCYVCTEGLRYALQKGYVIKINKCAIYRKGRLFDDYVNTLYALRLKYKEEGNDIMQVLCKFMLNSLYGKWGQKIRKEEREDAETGGMYWREEVYDMVDRRWVITTWLMNQKITQHDEIEGKNSFPGIAAHVTENARLLLWKIINSVGRDKVIYCDTDSIKIRKSDLEKVAYPIDKSELGALKIEDECKDLFIGGSKFYYTEKTRHIKGIPANAVEVAPGEYEFFIWPRMTYFLRNGIVTGYHCKKIKRRVRVAYDKGAVLPDGKITPLSFPLPGQQP